MFLRSFQHHVYAYRRFVDDVCVIHDGQLTVEEMLNALNSFAPDVNVTHEDDENPQSTHFLDLAMMVTCNGAVAFETYRKPSCIYNYLPWDSCHPISTKLAVVAGECVRLLRTNSCLQSYEKHIGILIEKLLARGYDAARVRHVVAKFDWADRLKYCVKGPISGDGRSSKIVVPFKVRFSEGIPRVPISRSLVSNLHLLDEELRDSMRIVLCHLSSPNMFVLRFSKYTGEMSSSRV